MNESRFIGTHRVKAFVKLFDEYDDIYIRSLLGHLRTSATCHRRSILHVHGKFKVHRGWWAVMKNVFLAMSWWTPDEIE